MSKYYTNKEVAEGIDGLPPISQNTLRRLRNQQKIKYVKIGKSYMYLKEWLEEYVEKHTVGKTA